MNILVSELNDFKNKLKSLNTILTLDIRFITKVKKSSLVFTTSFSSNNLCDLVSTLDEEKSDDNIKIIQLLHLSSSAELHKILSSFINVMMKVCQHLIIIMNETVVNFLTLYFLMLSFIV